MNRCPRCYRQYDAPARFCMVDGERLTERLLIDTRQAQTTGQQYAVLDGRYLVRGFIGKGATSKVYLAEDLEQHQPVAVKVLDEELAKTRGAEERFFREARAAQRIVHPNVVRILDVGHRSDGLPYLVMEFLFGESLGRRLSREKRLTLAAGIDVAQKAATGLGAAHAAGVVHRDVKSDNLFLVGEPGASYGVKLLDFGLARVKELPSLTGLGTAVGTMEYMAPEQVVTETTDARTDVYGLGVVLYRMWTGQLPFDAPDDANLLASQLLIEAARPAAFHPEIDPRAEAIIVRAMRKRPENRYPTMAALLDDLQKLQHGGALFAETPLVHEPDVFEPKASFARAAARYFKKKLGQAPPG